MFCHQTNGRYFGAGNGGYRDSELRPLQWCHPERESLSPEKPERVDNLPTIPPSTSANAWSHPMASSDKQILVIHSVNSFQSWGYGTNHKPSMLLFDSSLTHAGN